MPLNMRTVTMPRPLAGKDMESKPGAEHVETEP